jgi:hypothetical protein
MKSKKNLKTLVKSYASIKCINTGLFMTKIKTMYLTIL